MILLLFWWALYSEPQFYAKLQNMRDAGTLEQQSQILQRDALEVRNQIRRGNGWGAEINQDYLNAWLTEELDTYYPSLARNGIHDPRVCFRVDKVQVGVKLERAEFNGIISLDFLPSIPEKNTLDVEILGVYLGKIPAPRRLACEWLKNISKKYAISLEWLERNGNPVMRIKLSDEEAIFEGKKVSVEALYLHEKFIQLEGK